MDPARPKTITIIPARLESSRLPKKLLLSETGKPLIQHTYEAACRATLSTDVIVATVHMSIASAVRKFGGDATLTDPAATSGTDRVAEVAQSLEDVEIVVNVQGDEPELSGEAIDLSIEMLQQDPQAVMSTLATPIRSPQQLEDPACVKVVLDQRGRALYFSRSAIPFVRDGAETQFQNVRPAFLQHIGLYAYRRDFLLEFAKLPPSPLEMLEKLEQLRVLSAGHRIAVGVVQESSIGIDTPDDYRAFVQRERQRTMGRKVA